MIMSDASQRLEMSGATRNPLQDPRIIAGGLALLSLALYLWEFRFSNVLSLYDSGVYLAGSINLIHGVLPYRNFTFMQPPGILLALGPVAIWAKFFGASGAFLVGRVLTAIVSAADVGLSAWILRSRGVLAMLVGGVAFALVPVGAYETTSIRLEPWTLLFILLGASLLLRTSDEALSTRRIVLSGVLFGVAGLIKIFAFLPFLGMVIALYPGERRRTSLFVSSAAVGFALPALPFMIAAPSQFLRQVVIEQLTRKSPLAFGTGIAERMVNMVGIPNSWLASHSLVVAPFIAIAAAGTLFILFHYRPLQLVDRFFLLASIFTVAGLLLAAEFINYYGYFSTPFLYGLLGIALATVASPLATLWRKLPLSKPIRAFARAAMSAGAVLLIVALTLYSTTYYSNSQRVFGFDPTAASPITRAIPKNACVVYDTIGYGILSNRWVPNLADCPQIIDSYGMWLANGNHVTSPPQSFTAEWKSIFEHASYVEIRKPRSGLIPWQHGLWSWFIAHFHPILKGSPVYLYKANN